MLEFLKALPAPFGLDWLPFWVFSALGGVITSFIMISDIDERLRYPFFAKPIIGVGAGMSLAIFMNGQTVPPPISLAFWSFFGAVCSTPIITGFLVFISDQKRQNELYRQAQDKFLPFKNKEGRDE